MKKFVAMMIAILMICTMAVGFASCNSNNNNSGGKYNVGVQSGTTGWSYMTGDPDWGFEGFSNIEVLPFDHDYRSCYRISRDSSDIFA